MGKLVSLERAVPAGMRYVREQYSALTKSGITLDTKKSLKNQVFIRITDFLREEWDMWIYFWKENKGATWKSMVDIYR